MSIFNNEAAERLRDLLRHDSRVTGAVLIMPLLQDALAAERLSAEVDCIKRVRKEVAAERRATVERLRERYEAEYAMGRGGVGRKKVHAILDEEAAR